jgi:two-component system CheB/CheR fusion protein
MDMDAGSFDEHEGARRGREPTHVVGIGASAGGLEALEQLFARMPEQTGVAFVVVQHLSPDFKTQMPELLSRWTRMPVRIAEHEMPVEADTVYVMPPNRDMIVSGGRLLLEQRAEGLPLPIDLFLRSLAADRGSRSIGVILSGTGSDGSRGIREIHEVGGLVIVQTEESAKFDGMPRSAVGTGVADLIVRPQDMAAAVVARASDALLLVDEGQDAAAAVREGGMRAVFALLRERFHIDFSHYKPGTIARRTERRLQLGGAVSLADYIARLQSDRAELDALYEDLLIGVTGFFRDEDAFRRLETEVIPELVTNAPSGGTLRVWVAACATGEEAYSLAMLFSEAIARRGDPLTVKIFATDVHAASLEVAASGIYPEDRAVTVGPRRLERFFSRVDAGFKVSADLRQMIVFAPHNLIRDAPFTKLDLVSCRNLLIYFQPAIQRKVMALFHFALKIGGVLVLGPSESPGDVADEFDTVDAHWKMYKKRRDVRLLAPLRASIAPALREDRAASTAARGPGDAVLTEVFARLLDTHLPPGVLVNHRHEIVHTFGDVARVLKMPRGRPSLALLDQLEGDLKLAVAGALHRAGRASAAIAYEGVATGTGDARERIDLTVTPLHLERAVEPFFLVTLRPSGHDEPAPPPAETIGSGDVSLVRLDALEVELRHTKENLQATIEELEAANEELQATNEELLAANEELQSTNEELHSVNEELYTVNSEYQKKIDELVQLNDDIDHLLLSTEIHTLFLDDNLCIRKFTPRMGQVFHLDARDVGRRIDHFVHELDTPDLAARMSDVLDSQVRFEAEVSTKKGLSYLLRILPYVGRVGIGGVVVTLTDVTTIKEWERALLQQIEQRERFLAMLSHELRNPLAGVTNALALLERRLGEGAGPGDRDDGLARPFAAARRQSRQMARLLDDLLDVSRITRGKIELQRQRVDLRQLVEEALETLRPRAEQRHRIELVLPEAPVLVDADPTRMLQVVENLLANAVKFSPEDQPIRVELRADGDEASILVADRGAGIPAEQLDRIFDLFVQGDQALARQEGGLGVGLTLAKGLVELHGGRIEAMSEGRGRGSAFRVVLPTLGAGALASAAPTAATPIVAQPRLALVEDQRDIREPLVELLRDDGFEIDAAPNGALGLALILEKRPDVAILDIGLPDLDGFEVARRVREAIGATIRLVALTGYGSDEDRRKVAEAGFDAHLVKPVTPEDVIRVIRGD